MFEFLKLSQSGLIPSDREPVAVLPLIAGFRHAKQKMSLVVLEANGIGRGRMGRIDRTIFDLELLIPHPKAAAVVLVKANEDHIGSVRSIGQLQRDAKA